MNESSFFKVRLYSTAIAAVAIWVLLAWSHYRGGVPSHHILADATLPSISNWWGGLLLPVLTWFLLGRIQRKAWGKNGLSAGNTKSMKRVAYGFAGAALFGVLISTLFTLGKNDASGNLFLGVFALAFFLPIYRPQCLLGFVMGMTYTFGAVLPTVFGTMVGLAGVVIYAGLRPAILYVAAKLAPKNTLSQQKST